MDKMDKMDKKIKKAEKESFKTRDVLWYLVFTGFAVNYMVRINLNIAIVSMVRTRPKNNVSLTSECIIDPILVIPEVLINGEKGRSQTVFSESLVEGNTTEGDNLVNDSNNKLSNFRNNNNSEFNETTLEESTEDPLSKYILLVKDEEEDLFEWNEYHQALVLGAFFWLHWLTQVPGGILATKYGTKLVFGMSNFAGVFCCFFIPTLSYFGYEYLVALRVLQGLVSGFSWPAMHHMAALWIPPNERSKFVTAYLGSSIGAAFTFPMCGYIIDQWGWEWVFYVTGAIGTLWYIAWVFLVYDSPDQHPTITEYERKFIKASIGESVAKEKMPVPWKEILCSMPMWMNVLAQWGGIWGLFTLMTHAPMYIKVIHGWDIKATGLLSGLPHLLRTIWAVICSQIGDFLLTSNKMSRTNVRKLATAICCIGQGVCMFGLAYSGCNAMLAMIFLTAATAIHGAVSTGPLASFVDLSPNFASVQLGLSGMITVLPGFISPSIVGVLTYNNQTVGQWQKVFWIATGMLLVSGVLYVLLAKSEIQSWNYPKKEDYVIAATGDSEEKMVDEDEKEEKEGEPKRKSICDNNELQAVVYKFEEKS